MKIWTDRELKNRDGDTLWDAPPADGKDGVALTLGSVIERACNNEHPSELGALNFKQKKERFDLAMRCYKPSQQPVEISTEEAEVIKHAVARWCPPLVCGQVDHMIENGSSPLPRDAAKPNGAAHTSA